MTKRLAVEEVVSRFKAVHGDRYDYSKVAYRNNRTKVEIICTEHGSFFQAPENHTNGEGCPDCSGKKKLSTEQVVSRFKAVHGFRYDYSRVQHANVSTKVEIICTEHGSFFQAPQDHISGSNCPECASIRLTTEQVINRFKAVHGDRYDYSNVDYRNGLTKVEIICRDHGAFYQHYSDHYALEHGCPSCPSRGGGFNPSKPAYLYINAVGDNAIKFGITNHDPMYRLKNQSKSTNLDVNHIKAYYNMDGSIILGIENDIKNQFGGRFLDKRVLEDGWTETLSLGKLGELIEFIENRL